MSGMKVSKFYVFCYIASSSHFDYNLRINFSKLCNKFKSDKPAYFPVGTKVSAKYRGAYCSAEVKNVSCVVKVKVGWYIALYIFCRTVTNGGKLYNKFPNLLFVGYF